MSGFGFEYFANLLQIFELDNLKYKKKNLIFGYGFEYKFLKIRKKNQNWYSNLYPKIKNFCILNYQIWN